MMKKAIFLIIVGILILGGYAVWRKAGKKSAVKGESNEANIVLYVSATCPHCQKVEEWLDQNQKVKEKSGLVLKEVSQNRENSQELSRRAANCLPNSGNGVGVPFLYDEGKCIVGDQPIIDYFSQKYLP